jgi:hypothetical protein
MLKTSTPAKLIAAAKLIPSPLLRTLVEVVIAAGTENADDTVYQENGTASWDDIFRGSVESVLSDRLDRSYPYVDVVYAHIKRQQVSFALARDAVAFFKSHGYVA